MIVGFYARVSTEEQRERSTIDAQVDYARKRAELEGWDLRLFLDEGVSGTVPLHDRPAGAELLRAARAQDLDVVATYRVDRLGRKLRVVMEAIDALRIPYRSLTEPFDTATPLGRAMLGILGVFAELERDTFIERSRAGSDRVARLAGRWLGGIVPYGYRKREDLTLEVDERPIPGLDISEAEVIRMIFRWCADDGWGAERIARELDARGIPTAYTRDARQFVAGDRQGTRAREGKRKRATAGTWPHSRILSILHNELYRGIHRYGKRSPHQGRELIEREMPAIVSPALWERAQRRLEQNLKWERAHPRRLYELRGLLTCECGRVLIGTHYPTKRDGDVVMYRCERHPRGAAMPPRVMVTAAVAGMWADVVRFFQHPDEILRAQARGHAVAGKVEAKADEELLAIAAELRDSRDQEKRLIDLSARGLFSADLIEEKRDELRSQRANLERRAEHVRQVRASAASAATETAAVRRLLRTLADRARRATPEVRAEILRELVKRTRVSWVGKETRLEVVYRFGSFAATDRINADAGSRPNSPDEWALEHVIERVHVLPETGRWVRVEA